MNAKKSLVTVKQTPLIIKKSTLKIKIKTALTSKSSKIFKQKSSIFKQSDHSYNHLTDVEVINELLLLRLLFVLKNPIADAF
jgi:hypothetical protein